jgi:hypothetical protein
LSAALRAADSGKNNPEVKILGPLFVITDTNLHIRNAFSLKNHFEKLIHEILADFNVQPPQGFHVWLRWVRGLRSNGL